MPVFHSPRKETTTLSALQRLERSLAELRGEPKPTEDFARFERELHALFNQAERDIVGRSHSFHFRFMESLQGDCN